MTKPKYISSKTLERIADQILSDFLLPSEGGEFSEVDIYRIALGLGCGVEIVDFEPSNIAARVQRNDSSGNKYTVQLSRKDNPRRQKFSLAHEIAHIVLHDNGKDEFLELMQPSVDYAVDDLYKETQANMLASALLLPEKQIRVVWESSKSVDDVADVFNVSKEAVYNRLLNLGLLQNE